MLSCETDRILHIHEKSIIVGRVLATATAPAPSFLLYFQREYNGLRAAADASNAHPSHRPDAAASVSFAH